MFLESLEIIAQKVGNVVFDCHYTDLLDSESRRASVVSISGEDHGVKSVANITRSISRLGKILDGLDDINKVKGRHYISTDSSSQDKARLKLLEDHVTKHSLRMKPHTMCSVCTRILEGV